MNRAVARRGRIVKERTGERGAGEGERERGVEGERRREREGIGRRG